VFTLKHPFVDALRLTGVTYWEFFMGGCPLATYHSLFTDSAFELGQFITVFVFIQEFEERHF